MKNITKGVIIALTSVIFLICAVVGALSSKSVQKHTALLTSEKVSEILGINANIGNVSAEDFRSIKIEDIVLYDKQGNEMLKTPAVVLTLRLLSAFTDGPASVVDKIVVYSPKAYIAVRDNGEVNLNDINISSEGESTFKTTVEIEDGAVNASYEGKNLDFNDVNATLKIDGDDISFDGATKNFDADFKAEGEIAGSGDISLDLTGKNIDAKNYLDFMSILREKKIIDNTVSVHAGRIPEVALTLDKSANDFSIRGKAKLEDGKAQVLDTVIEDIVCDATFSDKEVILDASASANGQAAKVAGSIAFKDSPTMDLAVKAEDFDVSKVLPNLPVSGGLNISGKAEGTFKNPQVTAKVEMPEVEAMGVVLRDGDTKVRLIGRTVYIDEFNAKVFDGKVSASGELDTSDLSFMAHCKADNIALDYVQNFVPEAKGVYGKANVDVNIHGKSDDLKELMMYGRVGGKHLNYREIDIERLNGSFYARGGEIYIDYLSAVMANNAGQVGVEGKFLPSAEELDIALYGQALDIALATKLEPNIKGKGRVDIRANCAGALSNPNINARVSAVFGEICGQKFDSLRAVALGNPERLNIEEFAMLKDGNKIWGASGFFGIIGEKRLNIDATTSGARLESIVNNFSPNLEVTGNLNNTAHIGNTLDNPEVTGHLELIRGSVKGMLIQKVDMDYALQDNIFNVDSLKIIMPLLDLDANGKVNLNNHAINFEVVCNDLALERLSHKFPYPVDGHGTFTGRATGTIENPVIVAKIMADSLVLNGVTLNNIRGEADFKNKVLRVMDLGAEEKETNSVFITNATADFAKNTINGTIGIENGDIESIVRMANVQSKHITGKLDARVVTTGTLDEPHTQLEGVINKGTLAGYDIKDVVLRVSMNPKEFRVARFSGKEGEKGTLNGTLSLTPTGGLKGTLDGANIDFGLFTNLAGLDSKVVGYTDVSATFRGDVHNPAADITLKVVGGGILGATFDSLNGTLSLDKGSLNVKELVVAKDVVDKHFSASAKGIVPLKAIIEKQVENSTDSMDLTLHLDDANLSLLPALSKNIEWAEGETDGTLTLRGTLAEPKLNGSFAVKSGSVKVKYLRKPITNINCLLNAKGETLELQNLSGNIGSGNYIMKGSLNFNHGLEYNLDLDMNALQIENTYYTGPLSGKLNLTQKIVGRNENRRAVPKISGEISSEYAQIVVPVIPESDTPTPEVLLDLSLNFGNRVHLYEPQLYDMYFSGNARFTGSTLRPSSSGTIEVHRGGIIKVSHNTFRIHSGEVTFNQIGTFLPTIKFFADTHVGRTRIFVALMGPLGTDKIKPYLTSSPAMSQTEIIRLLTLGTDYQKDSNGSDEMKAILIAGLHMTVLAEVERELKKDLSLDSFSLAHGSGSTFERHREIDNYYSISTSKYINDKWLLRYNQGLGTGTGNYLLGVTYEIDQRTGIIFEHVDGANIVGVEARIRF